MCARAWWCADRSRGAQCTQQVEDARRGLEQYVAGLTIEAQDRAAMLDALEQGELFYDAQYGEARIVVSVSTPPHAHCIPISGLEVSLNGYH